MMRIEAYVVVCDNDCLADKTGAFPDPLKTDAEWAFFQGGLDKADVIVLGSKSHAVTPNPKARRRLVMTSRVGKPVLEDALTVLWNPGEAGLETALSLFDIDVTVLAVTGGKLVFDYFLESEIGYTYFHLSRVKDVYLKDGIKVFSALEAGGQTPESLLRAWGYEPGDWQALDEVSSVVSWMQAPASSALA